MILRFKGDGDQELLHLSVGGKRDSEKGILVAKISQKYSGIIFLFIAFEERASRAEKTTEQNGKLVPLYRQRAALPTAGRNRQPLIGRLGVSPHAHWLKMEKALLIGQCAWSVSLIG